MLARLTPPVAAVCCLLGAAVPSLAQPTCQPSWTGYGFAEAFNDTVYDVVLFDEKLIARGAFSTAGGAPSARVAIWDGQTWSQMPGGSAVGLGDLGGTMAVFKDRVHAVGTPGDASTFPFHAGWAWDGAQWEEIPTQGVLSGHTWRTTAIKSVLFASGNFTFPLPGGFVASRSVARFNGTQWDKMGDQRGPLFPFGSADALLVHGGELFIAGQFASADLSENGSNIITVNNICRWNGTTWQAVGAGFNGRVHSLASFDGSLYAAGRFTALGDGTPMNHIARWDGAQWHPVGGGVGMDVFRLAAADDGRGPALFVAGDAPFGAIAINPGGGQVPFSTIVRWNGAAWSPLGGGMSVAPTAIVSYDRGDGTALYMGGPFIRVDGVPNSALGRFARWGPCPMADTDGDGIFDLWETQGIDADCDGVIDLVLNSNPDHKSMFIETDAMAGYAPSPAALHAVQDAFNAAPHALVNNPDLFDGIDLFIHLDETNLPNFVFPNGMRDFQIVKRDHFGTAAERAHPNWENIREAKRRVYRYAMFAIGHSGGTSGGLAELPGNDFMVTLGGWSTPGGTPDQQSGTFMHELGHTLNLYHGGHQIHPGHDRRYNYKPNYRSVMNYSFQFPEPATQASWTLDYSRQALPALNEAALLEGVPIAPGTPWHTVVGGVPAMGILATDPCDFDRDGAADPLPVAADLNHVDPADPATPGDVLEGSEDWSRLRYSFRNSPGYADGADAPDTQDMEMDHDTHLFLQSIPPGGPPACRPDWNDDSAVNSGDISSFLTAWLASVTAPDLDADYNEDGQTNSGDISAFLTAWLDAVTNGC